MLKERINEQQNNTYQQAVNTCGLCNCAADKHCCCGRGFCLRLSADGLDSLAYGVAFTDTGADTCDKRKTCAYALSCENDSLCKKQGLFLCLSFHFYIPPKKEF